MPAPSKRLRSLALWSVLGLLLLALAGRVLIFRPATDLPGAHFNRGENAVWLDITWVMERHRDEEIAALARDLDARQVRYVYAYVSYLKEHGEFNRTYGYAADFTRVFKSAQPDMNVQAWIGIPLDRRIDLRDPAARGQVAKFSASMVARGFDGVHLDPEPIGNGDAGILALLEDVRRELGPGPTLSIATPRIWPLFPDALATVGGRFGWSAGYYREVARRVNQIALMTYDSTLLSPELYRLWTRFEVIETTRALDGTATQLLIGIPTFEETTGTHQPSGENMTSGLLGVIDGLNDADARPNVVTGVAIYPEWETDAGEWATYERLWLGR